MSQVDIRTALETRLATVTPALATAYENQPFTPPSVSTPYQRVYMLYADPDNPEMGSGFREQGYMQINLNYPLNSSTLAVSARAQAIRDAFVKGITLTYGSINVVINRTPSIGNGFPDPDRWVMPVKIYFYANNF